MLGTPSHAEEVLHGDRRQRAGVARAPRRPPRGRRRGRRPRRARASTRTPRARSARRPRSARPARPRSARAARRSRRPRAGHAEAAVGGVRSLLERRLAGELGRGTSSRSTFARSTTCEVGSTPSRSSSFIVSTCSRIFESSPAMRSTSSSLSRSRASFATCSTWSRSIIARDSRWVSAVRLAGTSPPRTPHAQHAERERGADLDRGQLVEAGLLEDAVQHQQGGTHANRPASPYAVAAGLASARAPETRRTRPARGSQHATRMTRSIVPSSCQAFFSFDSASAPAARSTSASACPPGWPSSGRACCSTRRASSPACVLYQSNAVVNRSANAATNTTQSDGRSRAKVTIAPRDAGPGSSRSRAATRPAHP